MKKVAAIKKLIAAFVFPVFLGGALLAQNSQTQPDEDSFWRAFPEVHAIQVVLSGIELDTAKDEKLMVLITYDGNLSFWDNAFARRSAYILAWFKYCRDDEHVTVNYYAVPKYKHFSDLPHHISYEERLKQSSSKPTKLSPPRGWVDFNNLLKGVVQNENIMNVLTGEGPKQLRVPLPQRLRDDALFGSMRDAELIDYGIRVTINGGLDFYDDVITGDIDHYYWGFKSHDTAFIRHSLNYSLPIREYIHNTIDTVKHAIQARETPEEWVQAAYGPRGVMRVFGRATIIPLPGQTEDPSRWKTVPPKKKKR